MKTLLLFLVLLLHNQASPKNAVYLCDSTNAKKYHLRNDCRGLSRCTQRIIEITLEDAKTGNWNFVNLSVSYKSFPQCGQNLATLASFRLNSSQNPDASIPAGNGKHANTQDGDAASTKIRF